MPDPRRGLGAAAPRAAAIAAVRAAALAAALSPSAATANEAELKACRFITHDTERLACYDRVLKRDKDFITKARALDALCDPVDDRRVKEAFAASAGPGHDSRPESQPYCLLAPGTRTERTAPTLAPLPPADAASTPPTRAQGADVKLSEMIFVRATPSLSGKNEEPAEFSNVRSGGSTRGASKAALLLVGRGSLSLFEDRADPLTTFYGGLGFARDKTNADVTKWVSTQNLRAGYWWIANPLRKSEPVDSWRAHDLAVDVRADDTLDTRTGSLEASTEIGRRYFADDRFGRTHHEVLVSVGATLFADWVLRDRRAVLRNGTSEQARRPESARGIVLRLDSSLTLPKLPFAPRLTPEKLKLASLYAREASGEERRSTQHSLALAWVFQRAGGGKQGLALERTLGGNFRLGEPEAPKTSLKLTVSYGD